MALTFVYSHLTQICTELLRDTLQRRFRIVFLVYIVDKMLSIDVRVSLLRQTFLRLDF